MGDTVDVAEFARILRVTQKAVHSWVSSGMPVAQKGAQGRGKKTSINFRDAVEWYFTENYERLELDRQRTRLASEQADKQALDNGERREELVSLGLVEREVAAAMSVFRANTLAIPSKLATELLGLSAPEIKAALEREARQLLEGIAAFDFGTPTGADVARKGSPDGEAAAASERQRVGGRAPNAKPRGKRGAGKVAKRAR